MKLISFIILCFIMGSTMNAQLSTKDRLCLSRIDTLTAAYDGLSNEDLSSHIKALEELIYSQPLVSDTVWYQYFTMCTQMYGFREMYNERLHFQKKLYDSKKLKGDQHYVCKLLAELGSSYLFVDKTDSADIFLNLAMQCGTKHGQVRVLGDIFLSKALRHQFENNQEAAVNNFLKADSLFIVGGHDGERGNVYFNLANSYYILDDLHRALHYFRKAALLHGPESQDYPFDKQAEGIVLIAMDSIAQAEAIIKEVDAKLQNAPEARSMNLAALQSIQYRLQKYKESLATYRIFNAIGGKNDTEVLELAILAQLELDNVKEAETLLDQFLQLSSSSDNTYLTLHTSIRLQKHLGIDARREFATILDTKDSTMQKHITDKSAELDEAYQSSLKQAENEKLLQQTALQTAQLKTQRAYLLGGSGIAALLALLASLFYRQRKKQEAYNQDLQAKNQKIDLLKREAIHRTNNHLNLATNLIAMQKQMATEVGAKEMMADSESKLRAIAAANKRLSDDAQDPYDIRDIVGEILFNNTALHTGNTVILDVDIQPVTLEKSHMSYLALIINELSTNSIKHAFRGIEQPKISVKIEEQDADIRLTYSDNGNFTGDAIANQGSSLINGLVDQMDGSMEVGGDQGYQARIVIPSFSESIINEK